jgi:hypothetical protein
LTSVLAAIGLALDLIGATALAMCSFAGRDRFSSAGRTRPTPPPATVVAELVLVRSGSKH